MTWHDIQRLPDGSLMIAEEHTHTFAELAAWTRVGRLVADVADAGRAHGYPMHWTSGPAAAAEAQSEGQGV